MHSGWAVTCITVDPRLKGGDAGGSQWASVGLAASELHRTVMPTPGLRAPADVARHSVIAGPTMEAGLRQAFIHVFLTCQAFRREQAKAQNPKPETQAQPKAYMPLGTRTSVLSTKASPNSQRISHGPMKSLETGIQNTPSFTVSGESLCCVAPTPPFPPPHPSCLSSFQGHSLAFSSLPAFRSPSPPSPLVTRDLFLKQYLARFLCCLKSSHWLSWAGRC